MSLNGLDSPAVVQAHQAALAETGGWFLLKYTSRDTIDLLSNGNGGVNDAKTSIEKYEEKSPLYGLVQYRKKKILVKYVPEGTSRLLQVRLAVQFQSVIDSLVPHDTIYSFTTPEELSESSLGLFTMHMHSAVSPTPSSSSLRNREMKEISEDAEESAAGRILPSTTEPQRPETVTSMPSVATDTAVLPQSAIKAKALLAKVRDTDSIGGQSIDVPGLSAQRSEDGKDATTRANRESLDRTHLDPHTDKLGTKILSSGTQLPDPSATRATAAPASIREPWDYRLQDESDSEDDGPAPVRRNLAQVPIRSEHLSASESSNISRWTEDVLASTGLDQRRAPRSSSDNTQRPKTSGTTDSNISTRRIANLPQSIRISSRPSQQPSRPGSQQSSRSFPVKYVPSSNLPPPLPSPTFPADHATRPPTTRSRPAPSRTSSSPYDGPAATPEKLRLMKALQMRKRNQLMAQQSAFTPVLESVPVQSPDDYTSTQSGISTTASVHVASDSVDRPVVSQHVEVASLQESNTTSPTSVTVSDQESTKPSSVEAHSLKRDSIDSLSSATNSSTTPRISKPSTQDTIKKDSDIASGSKDQPELPRGEPCDGPSRLEPQKTRGEGVIAGSPQVDPTTDERQDIKQANEPESEIALPNMSSRSPLTARKSKKRLNLDSGMKIATNLDDAETSDDDSLMEEMQNATVHEAKPMSVNRTPVTPVIAKALTFTSSRDVTTHPDTIIRQSVSPHSRSTTPEKKRAASRAGSTRSVSTALPQWPPVPIEPVPLVPKKNLTIGNTISKRIKDLESVRNRDSTAVVSQVKKDSLNRISTFSNIMKRTSFLSQFQHDTLTPGKLSPTSVTTFTSQTEQREPQPTVAANPWVQLPGSITEVFSPINKGETVSVTAQIIRDDSVTGSDQQVPNTMLNLRKSPLVVEHESANAVLARPTTHHGLSTPANSVLRSPTTDKRRFSFSSRKSASRKPSPSDTIQKRMSFASSKVSMAQSEASSVNGDKVTSRTSRMLKRLSGLGRKSQRTLGASPTRDSIYGPPHMIEENLEIGSRQASFESAQHVVDIGEVNVQFPETLLWKRRFLRVDDQGYLIFAPPMNDLSTRGRNRKFHLGDFMAPALPDLEREEMAWSIVLDLIDGRTVQCACENRNAQESALKMLTDAHNAYHQLYS